ncbi:MAG: 1-phosphofructokinase [Lachnospiraceae bacterium]|nr:1-phosphofructokinase [Lachnospiraceae bacterium]
MIYTLTTNPAIDMNICTNGLEAKKVNRTFGAVYTPNGKGLNVSFVLGHFGMKSKIMGFFGGFSGKYVVEESENMGYKVVPVWVEDTTRINIFLNDGETEYKLVNAGSFVEDEKQQELLKIIEEAEDMDYLSISGSLPRGIETDYYDKIFEICQKKDIDVILDISSPKLADLLKYQPLLIKPNDEELEDIFGIKVKTEEDMVAALEELHDRGAQNILLTLGEKGSYFYNGRNIYYATAQKIKLLSSACAGDSALAAFLSIWLDNPKNIEDAMKNAAATGANVAESNAIGTLEKVDEYRNNIQVRKVK